MYKFEDFINLSDNVFTDISSEKYRTYEFESGRCVSILNPVALSVSKSGGHRVWDAQGISHYVPSGWVHLYWEVKDNESNFVK